MSSAGFAGIQALEYFDMSRPAGVQVTPVTAAAPVSVGVPEMEVEARIVAACVRERAEAELQMRAEWEARETTLRGSLERTVRAFAEERTTYFARAEGEVVHLALAVARKILGREAQVDPMLLTGLVRVALDGMQGQPAVRVRVAPERVAAWQKVEFRDGVEVEAHAGVGEDECVLATEVGEARLSFVAQMKEVEQGFLDLLGRRPDLAVAGPGEMRG